MMSIWADFLVQQGARFDAATSRVQAFGASAQETARMNFAVPLTHLGLIAASGEEAAHFLHNQLTNDVEHLGEGGVRIAGYCSPKGRLLADLLMWKDKEQIMLQLPREIQAGVQKRLQMYILRAKVKLNDVSQERAMIGLAGPAVASALMPWFSTLPLAIYDKVESEAGTLIRHPNAFETPRYQWITSDETAITAWPQLTEVLQASSADAWDLAEIESGVPHITAATQEQFVPQMINFELIGGVNFQKGCYPGQEIVARSQYLGKLKRRMLRASVQSAAVASGMEIFSSTDPTQPCGMVVNAARTAADEADCLVEIKLEAVESEVHLGAADGPLLAFKTLPYPLTAPA
jgi:folate-binding protein YgfZ